MFLSSGAKISLDTALSSKTFLLLVLGQKLMIGSFVLVHVFLGVPMFKSLGDVGIVFQ